MNEIEEARQKLLDKISESDSPMEVMRDSILKSLYSNIANLPSDEKADYGKRVNDLKQDILRSISERESDIENSKVRPIDVTAPFDINTPRPTVLEANFGSIHPLMSEISNLTDIFGRMGFVVEQSREIDDQFNMFEALNFPKNHPARDDYDTFMTVETDAQGERLIAPAHTSTMQNRILTKYKDNLYQGKTIAAVVPDRVFRNEDVDARHEHTFYQIEGIYVNEGVNVGNLISTLQSVIQEYYGKELDVRVNPFYFPFTEPSFEFSLECPFCRGDDSTCKVCSGEGWIELLGCGMIHPNVLEYAGIDHKKYSGFAFGCGIDRLVMMKYGIEDVRHFESGKLSFLRQFN